MLVDANLLLYSVDTASPDHSRASEWLTNALEGGRRVGISWQTIGAFLRISTHPRITASPFSGAEAWAIVESWLAAEPVWVPPAGERTARILAKLVAASRVTGNLVSDAQLAALAIENGLTVCSADSDFARFPEVRWYNPLQR